MAIFGFSEAWYNRTRLHSTLDYCSPDGYEVSTSDLVQSL
jgi:transposase InsO family protein